MRKRTKIALLAGLAAVVLVMLWTIPGPPEPVYQGRRLSDWLKAHDRFSREEAEEAVRRIGTNAIPSLLGMFRAKDSALKTRFIDLVEKQDFITLRFECPEPLAA